MATKSTSDTSKTRKPRSAPVSPRKVGVLLRVVNSSGDTVSLESGLRIELVTLSSDKGKLFEAVIADRNLIALEYTYPAAATDTAPTPTLAEAAE